MDRTTSFVVLADSARRRVTRLEIRQMRDVFPFLYLPLEIRIIIYLLCLNFDGIKTFFEKTYTILHLGNRPVPPHPRKKTPHIFLLNKQIYQEVSEQLGKLSVVFDHGLLRAKKLCKIISPTVLCRVASITVSDVGHPILEGKILPESWHGYIRILNQLSEVLSKGHNLKELIVDFQDFRLEEHMTDCFDAEPIYECGFRDSLRLALNNLRKIRGVGKVTFRGINAQLAASVKATVESIPKTFLDLPRELRDKIYDEALDWSNISKALIRGIANWTGAGTAFPNVKLSTPAILLLNKQITQEATAVLHKKPLVITFPADTKVEMTFKLQVPRIMTFISRDTLKQVKKIHLIMESWHWVPNISRGFVSILANSPNLESFHLVIKDDVKKDFLGIDNRVYPDYTMHATLKKLIEIRNLKEVSFEGGDLPSCFTDPLVRIMTSAPGSLEPLPELMVTSKSGRSKVVEPMFLTGMDLSDMDENAIV